MSTINFPFPRAGGGLVSAVLPIHDLIDKLGPRLREGTVHFMVGEVT